jgi:hypothetical protein
VISAATKETLDFYDDLLIAADRAEFRKRPWEQSDDDLWER